MVLLSGLSVPGEKRKRRFQPLRHKWFVEEKVLADATCHVGVGKATLPEMPFYTIMQGETCIPYFLHTFFEIPM